MYASPVYTLHRVRQDEHEVSKPLRFNGAFHCMPLSLVSLLHVAFEASLYYNN